MAAIDCCDLVVRYGTTTAVDGLSLQAERGQVLALLGPNGAGKTSAVETLEGYRHQTSGSVRVLGLDPRTEHLALVGRPEVVFLDEPTAGVDPEGRLAIRQVIADLKADGVCIVLTTHELAEAERLADEVVIVVAGRAVARGTVAELAATGSAPAIRFGAPAGVDIAALAVAVGAGPDDLTEERPGHYALAGDASAGRIAALAAWLDERHLPLADLRTGGGSLEDAYLEAMKAGRDGAAGDPAADDDAAGES
jgi:ABC-type multidrug transport system ATPase subunit